VKFLVDVHYQSLNKVGEELCGDQIRVLSSGNKTRVVLCDGLGCGVKANILASLSSEIIINMLREDIPLPEVIETVIATLPVDRRVNLAYATNTMIEIDHTTLAYRIYNFDNPPVLFFRGQKVEPLPFERVPLLDRSIEFCQGTLQRGDLLVAMSDGLLHAGLGGVFNYNWDLEHLSAYIEEMIRFLPSDVRLIVEKTVAHTNQLYNRRPSDDVSMVGLLVRAKQAVVLFTGPPLDLSEDGALARRVLNFQGTRIVCGGTTGRIIGARSGHEVSLDPETARLEVPPMGSLPGIDIMTEGIFTLTSVLEWIEATHGNAGQLPTRDGSGAVQVAGALLDADEVTLLVGLAVNPSYQNPDLPSSISIRKNLMEKIADRLSALGKTVTIEFH
jgi:hypothetical protein